MSRRTCFGAMRALAALVLLAAHAMASASECFGEAPHSDGVRILRIELAGVPAIVRVPERTTAPPILLWHGFGPPAGEQALMDLLPLDEVPAAKVYLGLPMFGARAPEDPEELARRQARDLATGVFEPVVMGAARELPAVVAALRRHGCLAAQDPVRLFGFSAGGAAVLFALAEREVEVSEAAVWNASTGLTASVAAFERATGRDYAWSDASRALARRSDAVRRAADIAAGDPPPALLIVQGADDAMIGTRAARDLQGVLQPHYATGHAARLRLEIVTDMPHAVSAGEGLARLRALVGDWFGGRN